MAWPECGTWSNIGCFRPMFRPDSHSIDYFNAHKFRWNKFVCCLISDIPLQVSSLRRNLLGIGRKKHAGTLSSRMALWHSRTWSDTHHGLNFPSTTSNYSIKYCGTKCITAFLGLRCRSSLVRSFVTSLPSIIATTAHYSQSFTVILLSLRVHITQEVLVSGSESRQAVFPAEFLRNHSNITVLRWKSRDRHMETMIPGSGDKHEHVSLLSTHIRNMGGHPAVGYGHSIRYRWMRSGTKRILITDKCRTNFWNCNSFIIYQPSSAIFAMPMIPSANTDS